MSHNNVPDVTAECEGCPSRRGMLRGVAAAGVVGAAAVGLAACSSAGSGTTAAAGSSSGSTPASGSSTAASASSTGSGGGSGGTTLGPTSDVPVGGGKVYTTAQIVVTQPTSGEFKAFSAICTHAGCTVGTVSGGVIKCPCHGSEFHIADGSVAQGPASTALSSAKVSVQNGNLVAS